LEETRRKMMKYGGSDEGEEEEITYE